ncbi:MAG: hypothetical protein HOP33_17760 [Verrucomicrobia bacterium]|nr:hypothetical protein [Verrucomicrobiota bacterium]
MSKDKNHVSFWFWMFALFVAALPCIGFIMVIVWAIVGDNASRKNYFRAVLVWHLIIFALIAALWVTIMALGLSPEIQKQIQKWQQKA